MELPSDDEIKYMFQRNPHGAGFAIQGDTRGDGVFRVEYRKGFMNVDDLLEALGPRDKLKNLTVAIHCRIKTSGETDKFTTHPFPICDNYGGTRSLEGSLYREGGILFHNGVFSGLGGIINEKSSDTQDFVVGVANRYLKNAKMPNKIAQAIVNKIAGECRILVMYPKKSFPLLKIGTWYEHNGCYYSNTGYKDNETTYVTNYHTYSGSYYQPKSVNEYRTQLDEWGCNVAEYAWPSEEDDWIRFDDERWDRLTKAITHKEVKAGDTIVRFNSTGKKEWILDEDLKQIYTEDRREDVMLRENEDDYMIEMMDSGGIYSEHGYMWFEDDQVMMNWMDIAKKVGEFEYEYKDKHWYVDTVNLEAYTDQGLKYYFDSGEEGHVRKELKRNGYYIEHGLKAGIYDASEEKEEVQYGKHDWKEKV